MEDLIIGLVFLLISFLLLSSYTGSQGGGCTVKPEPTEKEKRAYNRWRKKNPPKGQGKQ